MKDCTELVKIKIFICNNINNNINYIYILCICLQYTDAFV